TAKELVKQTHQELGELLAYGKTPLALAQSCSGIIGSAPLFTSVINYRYSAEHRVVDSGTAASLGAVGLRVVADRERTNYPIGLTIDNLSDGFVLPALAGCGVDTNRLVGYVETALRSLVLALAEDRQKPV